MCVLIPQALVLNPLRVSLPFLALISSFHGCTHHRCCPGTPQADVSSGDGSAWPTIKCNMLRRQPHLSPSASGTAILLHFLARRVRTTPESHPSAPTSPLPPTPPVPSLVQLCASLCWGLGTFTKPFFSSLWGTSRTTPGPGVVRGSLCQTSQSHVHK